MPRTHDVTPDGLADGLATVTAVREACLAAGEPDPLDESARRMLEHHGLAAARLTVGDGGFAVLRDGALDLAVAPHARGHGLGLLLAVASDADAVPVGGESRGPVRAIERSWPGAGGVRTAWSHADHPAAARIAGHLGLVRARELWVLRRPTSLPLPALQTPPGVTIRAYADQDAAEVLAVNGAAFAHHPEQGGMDAADLAERMAEPWFDPAGLLLAHDDRTGALLAFHWTKRHGPADGEVYVVAVAPEAQGRGLGRAVTLAGLHHLADTEEVHLYVEADNAPARRTYERLGFTHAAADTHVQYRRPAPG